MAFTKRFLAIYLAVLLFLVTRAAWVNLEISIKCVGALRSFPPPLSLFHYALLVINLKLITCIIIWCILTVTFICTIPAVSDTITAVGSGITSTKFITTWKL